MKHPYRSITIISLITLTLLVVFKLQKPSSTLAQTTNNWLDPLVERIKYKNVGEFTNNRTFYTLKNGEPWLVDGIDATEIDPNRAQSRTVERWVSYSDSWWDKYSTTVTESYIPLKSGDPPLTIPITNVQPGLYSWYIYGTIDEKGRTQLPRVWNPLPFVFKLYDSQNNVIEQGLLLAKQGISSQDQISSPRVMQQFSFHIPTQGDYRVEVSVHQTGQETAEIMFIKPVDQLADIPNENIKSSQNLFTYSLPNPVDSTSERLQRDQQIWKSLPPLNTHVYIDIRKEPFISSPPNANIDEWQLKPFQGVNYWRYYEHAFDPLEFINPETGAVFPYSLEIINQPLPDQNYPDYGYGHFVPQTDFPNDLETNVYFGQVPILLGDWYWNYFLAINQHHTASNTGHFIRKCTDENDAQACHDTAVALVRFAYDWPALQMNFHDFSHNTHSPDLEYNTDWTTPSRRNGKIHYSGWSGPEAVDLMETYDKLFPFIQDNQALADSLQRFIPWIQTPDDITRLLDRYLALSSVRDFNLAIIRTNSVEQEAATLLGPHPDTFRLMDFTKTQDNIYPVTGTLQELYAKAINTSGTHFIGSTLYASGISQQLLNKAWLLKGFIDQGYNPIMDLTNFNAYPKMTQAAEFLINRWTAGGYQLMFGDASGGTHDKPRGEDMVQTTAYQQAFAQAFNFTQDPRFAWVMKYLHGNQDPEVEQAAQQTQNPIVHNHSRYIPDIGAVLERGSDSENLFEKGSVFLKLGAGQGHSHEDYLDLNIFSLGLPMAVDLAQRNEGNNWTRPAASKSYVHNHALAHPSDNPYEARMEGEPYLKSMSDKLLRATYHDSDKNVVIDRNLVYMDIEGTTNTYVFDVQQVTGETYHTWAFHGAESHRVDLNTTMTPVDTHPWLTRTLEGTRKIGTTPDKLEAIWTITREPRQHNYSFNGGGVIETVAAEPHILGDLYDANKPVARTKATLLGHGGKDLFEGFAYSDPYSYAFPFIWVQAPATPKSVYPAIYETYRGDTPLIANIETLGSDPLAIRLTTQTGQVDEYHLDTNTGQLSVVSRNSSGNIRWAKLSNATNLQQTNINLTATQPQQTAIITDINYETRTLTTDSPLPPNPKVLIGNPHRKVFLPLKGNGTQFTFDYDMLVNEGEITAFNTVNDSTVDITTNQGDVLFSHLGNRSMAGFTHTNESGTLHIRNNQVIKSNGSVNQDSFTDANGDTKINLKTYNFGIGDTLTLMSDVTVKHTGTEYQIFTNIPVEGSVHENSFSLQAADEWQSLNRAGDYTGDNQVTLDDFWYVIQYFIQDAYSIFDFNQVVSNLNN